MSKIPPETHFDATTLLNQHKPHNRKIKVSQFFDSEEVTQAIKHITEYKITEVGRYGYTWIHNDLRQLYDQWLISVGKGRGKKTTLQKGT